MTLTLPPRAVRNNNPGNLRKGITWDGLSVWQSDPEFCVFTHPSYGFRALAIDLHTKWTHGLKTIADIITRYSPPSENNTAAYIKAVSDGMGVDAKAPLDLNDPDELESLCKAIAMHESGGWFFTAPDLVQGVRLALESLNVQPPEIA